MDPWGDEDNKTKKNRSHSRGLGSDCVWLNDVYRGCLMKLFGKNVQGGKKPTCWYGACVLFVVLLAYASSGFYVLNPGERGLQMLFGQYYGARDDGLHYWWPRPIGELHRLRVDAVQKESLGETDEDARLRRMNENVMLTGDENIVNVSFDVHWKISDAYSYMFNVRESRTGVNVRDAAESAIREMLGKWSLVDALEGEGRYRISMEVRDLVQRILDSYDAGIEILSVQLKKIDPPMKVLGAFRDVQSARADKERLVNEAQSYKNEVLPKAKGDAIKIMLDAEAYKSEVVNRALGETSKFTSLYNEYVDNPNSVRWRLYLETMEDILSTMEKTVVTGDISGMLAHMPIIKRENRNAQIVTGD
ncbi:MAG: FtsH protease activity modulator HflK [Aaplasma endosymbiont of Hyalomma asiaticum]